MRTAAVYKWAKDVGGAVVQSDGTVRWRSTKMAAGEDDHAVVATALRLAATSGGTAVGLTIGDGDASWALARGLTATTCIGDVPGMIDEASTAYALAAAVRAGEIDVVLVGDAEEHLGMGAALAGHLGWPALAGVLSASASDGCVEAVRRTGDLDETVAVQTPVVLMISATAAEPKAPGMKELLAARKRPVEMVTTTELGVEVQDTVTAHGTRVPEVTAARLFTGDPTQAAAQLIAALRTEGVLR
ncbi:hypothetical protein [Actinotalea sp.]|uniref:hypothetical protein n=1 Tax=Actinotalea sp. TaxID=1872145 RepID=UPI003569618F